LANRGGIRAASITRSTSASRQQSQRTTRSTPSSSIDFHRVSLQIGHDISNTCSPADLRYLEPSDPRTLIPDTCQAR
jgi:hypothetical protein